MCTVTMGNVAAVSDYFILAIVGNCTTQAFAAGFNFLIKVINTINIHKNTFYINYKNAKNC